MRSGCAAATCDACMCGTDHLTAWSATVGKKKALGGAGVAEGSHEQQLTTHHRGTSRYS
eukprot:COSAG01_NODE_12988_length_1652_cov_2.701867_3_plen_58_part_01